MFAIRQHVRGSLLLVLLLASLMLLAACGGGQPTAGDGAPSTGEGTAPDASGSDQGSQADSGSTSEADEPTRIGVIQYVAHPSLDAARDGFMQALTENGFVRGRNVVFDIKDAQASPDTALTIAQQMVADGVDLILAIATPAAQAAATATQDIPIVITAVTDPVAAGLAETAERPGGNVTGTTDMNPVDRQLALIQDFVPDAKNVGIIYNSGEVNSQVQVEVAKEAAAELGLELVEATVSQSTEVLQAAQSLIGKVDAIYVPTDNTVVEALESVIKVAEQQDLPLIVGEGDSVQRGGLATYGISYYGLGHQTGVMAVEILKEGANPAEMAIQRQEQLTLSVNTTAAEAMGVTIPEELLAKAKVVE